MMWEEIGLPWQTAFSLGWEAFRNGSVPIGAVITDENCNIISTGRNRLSEPGTLNPKIAHAETECLHNLDIMKYPKVRDYIIYACVEPCPMCFGAIVMANMKRVVVAARDSYGGATHLSVSDPYISSKHMDIEIVNGLLGSVQIAMLAYFEIKCHNGQTTRATDCFKQDLPAAVKLAQELYAEKYLDNCVESNTVFSTIFNTIILKLKSIS